MYYQILSSIGNTVNLLTLSVADLHAYIVEDAR